MVVFVTLAICYGICHAICPEICPIGKNIHILKRVTVSRNLSQTHLLEVGLTEIPGDREALSIVRHVGLHVDFSFHGVFFEQLGLHLRV